MGDGDRNGILISITTAEATKLVLERLQRAGHIVARANAGGRKGGVRLLPAGWPDVVGFSSDRGLFVGVEIKVRKDDRLRAAQVLFRDHLLAAGGLWHEWRGVESFSAWCEENGL